MKLTKTIPLELEIEVHGEFIKGYPGSEINPPERPSFNIIAVTYKGADISQLLTKSNFDWADLESECLEDILNQ